MRALGCGGTCVSMPCSMMSVLELALCKLKSSEEHEPDLLSVDEESDLLSVAGVMMEAGLGMSFCFFKRAPGGGVDARSLAGVSGNISTHRTPTPAHALPPPIGPPMRAIGPRFPPH